MLNLSSQEIKEITGKSHRKPQISALLDMGIPFKVRPDGTILVARQAYLSIMGCEVKPLKELTEPDFSSLNA